ncbi:MAG: STAS domain-containing protein [Leptospiraceae bacterium]|nr:STAS domain-containing protein [Leptospiraceae bacterium]MCB1316828.1 STAS domain-containing protein [Leptospiraceae bacterium]MCB1322964.1 STAS domain-containing protein [Leptospiraceae bacterium]
MDDIEKKLDPEHGLAEVRLSGRIQMYDTDRLEEALNELVESDHMRLIIDMTAVTYICSSALGVLIAAKRKVMKHEGEIRLVVSRGEIFELLKVTMLDKLFRVYMSLEDARQSIAH